MLGEEEDEQEKEQEQGGGIAGLPQGSSTAATRPMNRAMRRRPGRLHACMRASCAGHVAGCGMTGRMHCSFPAGSSCSGQGGAGAELVCHCF